MSDVTQLPRARKAPQHPGLEPDPQGLYYPIEQAILRNYFGLGALAYEAADLYEVELPENHDEEATPADPSAPIRLQRELDPDTAVANAVARICLNAVQGRLPQWGVGYADGRVVLGRQYEKRRGAPVEPKPIFLF
jgi:hypothetical protein